MGVRLDVEGYPVPTCAWHPDRTPVAACIQCGRTVCKECAKQGQDGYVCVECDAARPAESAAGLASAYRGRFSRFTRLYQYLGLVPVVGAPAAAVTVVFGVAAMVRRRSRRSDAWTALLCGLVGLGLTAAAIVWLVRR